LSADKMDLVIGCVTNKYATFSGRARPKEFWLFQLFYTLIGVVVIGIEIASFQGGGSLRFMIAVFGLVTLIPFLAVTVRRLHDTNRRGWWILIGFVPLIGAVWMLVLFCLRGANRFGEDPLK